MTNMSAEYILARLKMRSLAIIEKVMQKRLKTSKRVNISFVLMRRRGDGGGRSRLPGWGAEPWSGNQGGEAPPPISAYRGLNFSIQSSNPRLIAAIVNGRKASSTHGKK